MVGYKPEYSGLRVKVETANAEYSHKKFEEKDEADSSRRQQRGSVFKLRINAIKDMNKLSLGALKENTNPSCKVEGCRGSWKSFFKYWASGDVWDGFL